MRTSRWLWLGVAACLALWILLTFVLALPIGWSQYKHGDTPIAYSDELEMVVGWLITAFAALFGALPIALAAVRSYARRGRPVAVP